MIKKKYLYCFLVGLFMFSACSSAETQTIDEQMVVETNTPKVVPTDLLTMKVQGMSCEMGCGAAIRKELLTTNAVQGVSFDFKMGRDTNIAKISYDKTQISKEKLSEMISKINDNQFFVQEVSNEPLSSINE